MWETPTKPGRPAAGLEYVRHVAGSEVPWFAIGGIDASNVDEVVEAGASRIVVVRAIRDAADPRAAAAAAARRARSEASWRSAVAASGASSASAQRPRAAEAEPRHGADLARGYARGREKDEAARAALKPLREGERPRAVTVAGVLALVLGLANLVALPGRL